tara:strand:- start:443 stop:757 length:315 start_codon:yes stop_codon:yes gene_type:complete
MSEINPIEMIDSDRSISIDKDLTILPDGIHDINITDAEDNFKSKVEIKRELEKITASYSIGKDQYSSVMFPDGRVYNTVKVDRGEGLPPAVFQSKATWRYTKNR